MVIKSLHKNLTLLGINIDSKLSFDNDDDDDDELFLWYG